ncbi:endoglucanase [Methanobrevibacter sp.]
MSDDRDKLLQIMNSLEADYRSGKISKEKYSYFRSKYEDKLNSIDAVEATRRIRSMQGKPNTETKKRSKKPTNYKKKQEQDLVQKYIINPKQADAKYNKKKKSSMSSNTFKLVAILVLIIAFTAGVAYGVFSFDFDTGSENAGIVAIVEDTAFPEINAVVNTTVVNNTDTSNSTQVEDTSDDKQEETVETTTETTTTTQDTSDSSSSSSDSSSSNGGSSNSGGSSDSGGGSSDSGGGSSDSGGGEQSE